MCRRVPEVQAASNQIRWEPEAQYQFQKHTARACAQIGYVMQLREPIRSWQRGLEAATVLQRPFVSKTISSKEEAM